MLTNTLHKLWKRSLSMYPFARRPVTAKDGITWKISRIFHINLADFLPTCVRSRVSFQIEGIVEALATEGAEVALHVAVALHVPVQQPLQAKRLRADPEIGIVLASFSLFLLLSPLYYAISI